MQHKKGNPTTIRAWAIYDWANSVYSLVITSAIFPVYYTAVTQKSGSSTVNFLGFDFVNTALYSYAISFSFFVIMLFSPLLSGIADFSGRKKLFMKFFCYLGAISCSSLFFFDGSSIELGIICSILASIGFAGSIVFYNAYLPEIAAPNQQDAVSAKGFSYGYIGSTIMLLFNLMMLIKPDWFFDLEGKQTELMQADPMLTADTAMASATSYYTGLASRISFLMVGIWWAGFAQITFYYLPKEKEYVKLKRNAIFNGYKELKKVWMQLKEQANLKRFLLAFFFYNMSVQTVMYIATLFGKKELQLQDEQLIYTIFIIQLVAIAGAYLFSWLSSRMGNIKALTIAVIIWIGIGTSTYLVFDPSYDRALIPLKFYCIAFVVGMVMGGIQSLSRSTYSKLLPETKDHASYFSFYDVTEKLSIVLGTFSYGYIEVITGSMRFSVLFFTIILVIGLTLLLRVKKSNNLAAYS